ncbi:hypothetical protein [Calycomorphotria hydatis]|uniref:hypothetical protein n=1 Tax=Calycomorphotria hydatis TaxID=2528027 RepID=UPI0018D2111A|nr:hypothetical protein [Calycomorphotria hydatis]
MAEFWRIQLRDMDRSRERHRPGRLTLRLPSTVDPVGSPPGFCFPNASDGLIRVLRTTAATEMERTDPH